MPSSCPSCQTLGRTTVILILTCLTDDCVYQVSDRRLTSFDPPRSPIDDETNKALFVSGRVIIGYTGISKVNGENTDLWLTRVAASVNSTDMGAISSKIRDEATSAFRRMNFASRYKRHAFQGAGWFSDPDRSALRPGIVTVHNALEFGTLAWLPYARPSFDLVTSFPRIGRAQFHLWAPARRCLNLADLKVLMPEAPAGPVTGGDVRPRPGPLSGSFCPR